MMSSFRECAFAFLNITYRKNIKNKDLAQRLNVHFPGYITQKSTDYEGLLRAMINSIWEDHIGSGSLRSPSPEPRDRVG